MAQCESNGIGVSDCKHTEDVGVVCSDKRIPGFKFVNSLTNNINVSEFSTNVIPLLLSKNIQSRGVMPIQIFESNGF